MKLRWTTCCLLAFFVIGTSHAQVQNQTYYWHDNGVLVYTGELGSFGNEEYILIVWDAVLFEGMTLSVGQKEGQWSTRLDNDTSISWGPGENGEEMTVSCPSGTATSPQVTGLFSSLQEDWRPSEAEQLLIDDLSQRKSEEFYARAQAAVLGFTDRMQTDPGSVLVGKPTKSWILSCAIDLGFLASNLYGLSSCVGGVTPLGLVLCVRNVVGTYNNAYEVVCSCTDYC